MLTIVDIVIIGFIVGIFYLLNLTGIIPIIICLSVGVLLHFGADGLIQVLNKKQEDERLIYNQKNRILNAIKILKSYSNNEEISDFISILSEFVKKKNALIQLSNDAFVQNEISKAEDYLIRLSESVERKLKIFEALSIDDSARYDIIVDIRAIIVEADDYVSKFSDLLIEVERSMDDNCEDAGNKQKLSDSINRLKKMRENSQFEDGLFVTSSQSENLGI